MMVTIFIITVTCSLVCISVISLSMVGCVYHIPVIGFCACHFPVTLLNSMFHFVIVYPLCSRLCKSIIFFRARVVNRVRV